MDLLDCLEENSATTSKNLTWCLIVHNKAMLTPSVCCRSAESAPPKITSIGRHWRRRRGMHLHCDGSNQVHHDEI